MDQNKVLRSTHEGLLSVGDLDLNCYVLNNGERVFNKRAMATALGLKSKGGNAFIKTMGGKSIGSELSSNLVKKIENPIIFKRKSMDLHGYKADVLVEICDSIFQARKNGRLSQSQIDLAEKAEILIRSFAKVGVIALIDEATGYQDVRDKQALQKILDKYLTDEWAKWTKRFPDEFYKELFRLRNLNYPTPLGRKPQYIGKIINDIVYSRLAPGILEELKSKNPSNDKGIRKRKYHQYLTRDFGHPKLKEYLSQIIFLMKTCSTYREFHNRLARAVPQHNKTMPLPVEISS